MKFKLVKHLHHVNKHRWQVFLLCSKCGLFWRGLIHDLSKYSPAELFESVKYYAGDHSPLAECRKINGYTKAWLHHFHRNKHHLEFWYDHENKIQMNMPYKYAAECVCDKIAATKCYKKRDYKPTDVLEHWQTHGIKAETNDNMKDFFTKVFTDLALKGEDFAVNKKYLKNTYNEIVLKGENNGN